MVRIASFNLLFWFCIATAMTQAIFHFPLIPVAEAAELSSSLQFKVKKIAQNIDKTHASLKEQGTAALSDPLKAKQLGERIDSYGRALKKMPSDDDPVLLDALSRHSDLVTTFNSLVQSASASNQTEQADQPASQASGASASSSTATQSATTSQSTQSSGKQLVSGQRVRVKKLTRDMQGLQNDLVTTGPSPMQRASEVQRYSAALEKYATGLKRYIDYKGDPDVTDAARAYQSLRTALSTEYQRAQAQLTELGDVQGILAAIESSLSSSTVPKMLWRPISDSEAQKLVTAGRDTKQRAEAAITEIRRIAPLAYLDKNNPGTVQQGALYDQSDMNRLFRWAQGNIADSDAAYAQTVQQLDREMASQKEGELQYFYDLDPDKPSDRMNAFLQEGADLRIYERLDQLMTVPTSLAAVQTASGEQVALNVRARIEEINTLRGMYRENRQRAIGESRLPTPASEDASRLEIAAMILAEPSYEYGEHGPIVLTTPQIDSRSKEVSRETIKDVDISLSGDITWSGTRETWFYDWDEFKFATPLKHENGDWYVWWITAKYYRSGASTTPLNQWVSGRSTQGDLILEKNFR